MNDVDHGVVDFPTRQEEQSYLSSNVANMDLPSLLSVIHSTDDFSDLAKMGRSLDALRAAVREFKESHELQNKAAIAAIEWRCKAAEEYDKLGDSSGARNDLTSSTRVDEVESSKESALDELGVNRRSISKWRKASSIAPNDRLHYYDTWNSTGEDVTLSRLISMANTTMPRWKSTESNEWYTPSMYTDAAHNVMGGIDLDPASSEGANGFVNASEFYTIDDDGLTLPWFGRVWLNPPYNSGDQKAQAPLWIERLINEYEEGNVTEAVALLSILHTRHDVVQRMIAMGAFCITNHYIKFVSSNMSQSKAAPTNSVIIYLGENVQDFQETFSYFGVCK